MSGRLDEFARAMVQEDLAYHQLRVLLLVDAVASAPGHASKLDGLTKLAKLDFLVRYPDLAPVVLDGRAAPGPASPGRVEAPMIRYKYGPWDDRYYPVIGALVGRGLLAYTRGRRGSVALRPTAAGRRLAAEAAASDAWSEIARQCRDVAAKSAGMTGSQLKDAIYERLPDLMNQPHRQVIQ